MHEEYYNRGDYKFSNNDIGYSELRNHGNNSQPVPEKDHDIFMPKV